MLGLVCIGLESMDGSSRSSWFSFYYFVAFFIRNFKIEQRSDKNEMDQVTAYF
jgi:hypothetical protein